MNPSDSEGLGLSVLIYMAAIVGGLALIVGPVYLANKGQVYENPALVRADPLLNGPIIGERVSTRIPLALLKHESIIDPKVVAALNAKTKKTEPHRATHQVAARSRGTPVAELQPEPRRQSFFLFRLFGG